VSRHDRLGSEVEQAREEVLAFGCFIGSVVILILLLAVA